MKYKGYLLEFWYLITNMWNNYPITQIQDNTFDDIKPKDDRKWKPKPPLCNVISDKDVDLLKTKTWLNVIYIILKQWMNSDWSHSNPFQHQTENVDRKIHDWINNSFR